MTSDVAPTTTAVASGWEGAAPRSLDAAAAPYPGSHPDGHEIRAQVSEFDRDRRADLWHDFERGDCEVES